VVAGIPGAYYAEGGWEEALSGLSPSSFLMTKEALLERLRSNGFEQVEGCEDDPVYAPGVEGCVRRRVQTLRFESWECALPKVSDL
jgi:hypothetical protein